MPTRMSGAVRAGLVANHREDLGHSALERTTLEPRKLRIENGGVEVVHSLDLHSWAEALDGKKILIGDSEEAEPRTLRAVGVTQKRNAHP